MKYVIWGCGRRGKVLSTLFEDDTIAAFIDSDKEIIGSEFHHIKVVSFEEYLKYFKNYPVIIAVKGQEKNIGEQLDYYNIPWIVMDTVEYISILHQLSLGIGRIIEQDSAGRRYIIYGYNLYGVYLYYLLKKNNKECCFVLQDNISSIVKKMANENLPWVEKEEMYKHRWERIFAVLPFENNLDIQKIETPIMNAYEIYKYDKYFINPELKKFKNIHKGKRCFVIANGPSLKMEDLTTLYEHGEICLAVNGIHYAFSKTKWRPDYYFISDSFGTKLHWSGVLLNMEVKEKFVGDIGWPFTTENVPNNIHIFHHYMDMKNIDEPLFSEDFSKGVYWGGTIIYDGPLQMAAYMGFSEIYLIGADCTKEGKTEDFHFTKEYACDAKNFHLDLEQVFNGYKAARRYCEQHQIKIRNATRGGSLEVLERVNFDELF